MMMLLRRVLHESVGGLYLLLGRNDEGRRSADQGRLMARPPRTLHSARPSCGDAQVVQPQTHTNTRQEEVIDGVTPCSWQVWVENRSHKLCTPGLARMHG